MASPQDGSPPSGSRTGALLAPSHAFQHPAPLLGVCPSHGGEPALPKFLPSSAALPAPQQTAVRLHPPDTVLGARFSKMIRGKELTELGVPWCSPEEMAPAQVVRAHRQRAGSWGLAKEASSGGTSPKSTPQSWQEAIVKDEGTSGICSPLSRGSPGPLVPLFHRLGMLSTRRHSAAPHQSRHFQREGHAPARGHGGALPTLTPHTLILSPASRLRRIFVSILNLLWF